MGGWEERGEEELIQSRMNQAAAEWVEIIEPRTKVSRWIEIIEIISISEISLIIWTINQRRKAGFKPGRVQIFTESSRSWRMDPASAMLASVNHSCKSSRSTKSIAHTLVER